MVSYILFAVRGLLIIPAIEIFQIITFGFCVCTITLYTLFSCISFLDYNAPIICLERSYVIKILQGNDVVNIFLQIASTILETGASLIFLAGIALSVSINFGTIKMYSIIPISFYLFFPLASVVIPMCLQIIMPMVINIYEGGQKVVWKWKYYTNYSQNIKYVTRMITARKKVRINVGLFGFVFFFLKKSTKVTYYYTILSYTISAIMEIHVNRFQGANGV